MQREELILQLLLSRSSAEDDHGEKELELNQRQALILILEGFLLL